MTMKAGRIAQIHRADVEDSSGTDAAVKLVGDCDGVHEFLLCRIATMGDHQGVVEGVSSRLAVGKRDESAVLCDVRRGAESVSAGGRDTLKQSLWLPFVGIIGQCLH